MKKYPELESYTSTKLCHIDGVSVGSVWIDVKEWGPVWTVVDTVNVINHNGRFSVIRHWGSGLLELSRRRRNFTVESLEVVSFNQSSASGSCQLIGYIDYTASRPLFNVRAITDLNSLWIRSGTNAVLCLSQDPGASAVIITNNNGVLDFDLR